MMTKKVLEPIGYDYSQIIIRYSDRVPEILEKQDSMQNNGIVEIDGVTLDAQILQGM